jgi:DNA-binding NarL/FixJ family response regulator
LLTRSEHKTKTNKERYADRIEGIIFALQEGYPVKDIAKAFNVTTHSVTRYKRKLFGKRSYTKQENHIGA